MKEQEIEAEINRRRDAEGKRMADRWSDLPMPMRETLMMAIHILAGAKCPKRLLTPIFDWANNYSSEEFNELSPEEIDKLKLVKWNEWAKRG